MLVVSYTFPPDAAVGGLRIARLCHHLPEQGTQPVVLSVDSRFYEELDYSVALPQQTRVVRTNYIRTPRDWYRCAKRVLSHAGSQAETGEPSNADPGLLRRQVRALLDFPDCYWGWYFPREEVCRRAD
jgi:hypothetical protein